jgi:hypothetical protein
MRNETVTVPVSRDIDWKGIGYLFSIAGALALGAVSCFKTDAPPVYFVLLAVGVTATIIGFGVRYFAHLKQKREIEEAKRKAERR